jgi:hypothetical protein
LQIIPKDIFLFRIKFVLLQLHLPHAAVMSSEDDGTDRAARAERCLHQLCRVVREVDRKVSHEAEHYILEGVTMNNIQIPEDNSLESIKIREKIIRDFYREWKEQNPSQRKYNVSLKEYINIRMVSIVETSEHAAKTYLSTIAVLQLDAILTGARKVSIKKTKPGNKNQQPFERMMIMEYELAYIGKIKMTVGIRRRTHEKVQYCITAIQSI